MERMHKHSKILTFLHPLKLFHLTNFSSIKTTPWVVFNTFPSRALNILLASGRFYENFLLLWNFKVDWKYSFPCSVCFSASDSGGRNREEKELNLSCLCSIVVATSRFVLMRRNWSLFRHVFHHICGRFDKSMIFGEFICFILFDF